jgi:putative hydrolase of the HAD superfamily
MFPFDVILFDVGGVLLTNGWDHRERAAAVQRFGLNGADFEARHLAVVDAWERGRIGLDAYLDAAAFNEPRSFTREEFFRFILGQSQILPDGALGIVEQLAALKLCRLGILNNEARETNEFRFEHFGLRRYFPVTISSCFVGLRKPEPAIYRCALDILGSAGERTLFIDDREENVAGARDVGIRTIRFEGEDRLRRQLEDLGVLEIGVSRAQ